MSAAPDPIVEAVREQLRQRSAVGVAKYGTTLDANPAGFREWIQHAQEEAMDLANYLERLKREADRLQAVERAVVDLHKARDMNQVNLATQKLFDLFQL